MKRFPYYLIPLSLLLSACNPSTLSTPNHTIMPTSSEPPIAASSPSPFGLQTNPVPVSRQLTVFAAASLTNAFTEIGMDFELSHPGVKVTFNFAGSQSLSAQLMAGASADVFASANRAEMDKVVTAGLIHENAPVDFLTNSLLVILPPNNPAGIQTLQDLARPGLKLDLADVTVPAGKYARQVLQNLSQDPSYGSDYANKVLANVVSNEVDVEMVVAKVQLGEVDAGIVYNSDSVAEPDLKTVSIPPQFNVIATYPIAPIAGTAEPDLASGFIAYLLSPEGQAILQKWGFTPVQR